MVQSATGHKGSARLTDGGVVVERERIQRRLHGNGIFETRLIGGRRTRADCYNARPHAPTGQANLSLDACSRALEFVQFYIIK